MLQSLMATPNDGLVKLYHGNYLTLKLCQNTAERNFLNFQAVRAEV